MDKNTMRTMTASELEREGWLLPEREFVSGIAPLNGFNFFRRDKQQSDGVIALTEETQNKSVYATCIAACKDSPVKPGDRAVIAFRNVREVWHRNERVCVIKSDDILAVLEE